MSAPALRMPMTCQTLYYVLAPERFFARAHRRYGDAFRMRVLGESLLVLADPAAVREVFAYGPQQVNSGEANEMLRPVLGTRNLLLLDGEEHLHRRKMVLGPFHGERMRAYEQVIRQAVSREIASWPIGQPAAVLPRMQALTFSVIMRTVFGVQEERRLDTLGQALAQMLSWITDTRRVLIYYLLGPDRLMRVSAFRRQLEAVDQEVLAEIARRRRETDLSERQDILSLLIQARDEHDQRLSDEELRDELVTLLIAGHETTATLIAWAIYELARDQDSQRRLAHAPEGFSDAVITETLRLHPPIPLVVRLAREPIVLAGHRCPSGTIVAPCQLLVHRRAQLYPDPWVFKPTRFLTERPVASEWFPFGGAVRRCVGASFAQFEARIVLEELIGRLRFVAIRRRERTGRRAIVLTPSRGARVIATPRTPSRRQGPVSDSTMLGVS
jgi:cytochrome P450 family 135